MFSPIFLTLCATILPAIYGFRTQSTAVRGVLMCGDRPLTNTLVKLWDDDSGPDLDDLLEEGHTDHRGYFELSGKTDEM